MDFTYDDEQDALRDAVRGLVGKAYSDYENRRQTVADDPGFDEKMWARMAEMGLLGLPFSEEDGGVGAGPVEISIVCQELGRVIAPEPYLAAAHYLNLRKASIYGGSNEIQRQIIARTILGL